MLRIFQHGRVAACVVFLLIAARPAFAQESQPSVDPEKDDLWSAAAEVEASYVAGGELEDAAGEVETLITDTSVRVRGQAWRGGFVSLSAGYEYRHYEFDGGQPFLPIAEDPWDDVHSLRFGVQVLQGITREWGVFAGANVRASAEDDADLGDGVSGIFLLGVGHDFGNGFRAGIGAVGIAAFEDDFSVFPAVQFDWQIDEEWRAKLEGLRFDLTYTPAPEWTFGIGARADGIRFRLPENSALPDGIVDDRRISAFIAAMWRPVESLEIKLETGLDVYRRFRIEDENGDNGESYDSDPAPFVGLGLTYRF